MPEKAYVPLEPYSQENKTEIRRPSFIDWIITEGKIVQQFLTSTGTIFTVPQGQTFFLFNTTLQAVSPGVDGILGQLTLDWVGGTATSTLSKCFVMFVASGQVVTRSYSAPRRFSSGESITYTRAGCSGFGQIFGYLVPTDMIPKFV